MTDKTATPSEVGPGSDDSRIHHPGRLASRGFRCVAVALVGALALNGLLHVAAQGIRDTDALEMLAVGADGESVSPSDSHLPTGVALLTGAVAGSGNRIAPPSSLDGTLPRLAHRDGHRWPPSLSIRTMTDDPATTQAARPGSDSRIHRIGGLALIVLRWMGLVLVATLALVGFLYVTRGTAVQHVRGVGTNGAPLAPSDSQFPLGVALLTGTALSAGNSVELALNGDGTFPRLWEDLRSAKESIIIQSYYGAPGSVADTLREILLERAASGIRVFVLYDAFGTSRIPRAHLDAYRAAGVQVAPFRPLRVSTLHTIQNRSHVRAIIVDDRIGWTGGFGFDDKWLGDGHTNGSWRETNVRFEGPAVLQLEVAFASAWAEATGVLFTGRVRQQIQPDAVKAAGLLYASPTIGTTVAERFLAMSIAGARKTLYITNAYFAPDRNFTEFLTRAARRGVDVRILAAGPRTDIRIARLAARARYSTLLESGVRIYEWRPSSLHAKTFVVDGIWSTIGTMNFDNRSLALNEEVTLMVLDEALGSQMDSIFLADLEFATEIIAEEFDRRPWYGRVGEWATHLITRLL